MNIIKTIEFFVSPKDLAEAFCEMDGDEQATFFSKVAENAATWEFPFEFQMEAVHQSKNLTIEGRKVMWVIGEYSSES